MTPGSLASYQPPSGHWWDDCERCSVVYFTLQTAAQSFVGLILRYVRLNLHGFDLWGRGTLQLVSTIYMKSEEGNQEQGCNFNLGVNWGCRRNPIFPGL